MGGVGPPGSHAMGHASFGTHTWGPCPLSWTGVHRGTWFAWPQLIRQNSQWEPVSPDLHLLTAPLPQRCGHTSPGQPFLPTTGSSHTELLLPTGPACLLAGVRCFPDHLTWSPTHGSSLRAIQADRQEWQPGPDFQASACKPMCGHSEWGQTSTNQ